MIDAKRFSGKLNLDDSEYALPQEDYVNALNITHDAIEGNQDSHITNIVANKLVNNTYLPTGRNKTRGAIANAIRNTVIFINWNSNGYSGVYEYENTTRTITPIFQNLTDSNNVDILGITEFGVITGMNIYNRDEGDLFFFLDGLNRPTYMDIALFKAGAYTPVTREIINLATRQPLSPPTLAYGNDNTKRVNYLRNKFFRFKQVYQLDSFFESSTSPMSTVEIPVSILDDNYNNDPTKNNIITLSLDSGDKDVRWIIVLMSFVEKTNSWSDFKEVIKIDKEAEGIADNVAFTYIYDNSGTYPNYDVAKSDLLFDYVPFEAKAQEMPNGNVLAYGAITDGYDKDLIPDVINVVNTFRVENPPSGTLTQVTKFVEYLFPLNSYLYTTFFGGVPAAGTIITMQVRKISDSSLVTAAACITVEGDNQTTVLNFLYINALALGIYINPTAYGLSNLSYIINGNIYTNESIVTITPPTSSISSSSVPLFKFSSTRNMALAYYDEFGVTNGVLYNTQITFPAWAENAGGDLLAPNIESKIYHRPPIWAKSYQYLFTKDDTFYLEIVTGYTNSDEAGFIYFDVSGIQLSATKYPTTSTVISYSFQDGDRMRVIRIPGVTGSAGVYSDLYDTAILGLLDSPTINGITYTGQQFLKVKKDAQFSTAHFATSFISLQIEIYRPIQNTPTDENKTFYECGIQFPILNPGTSLRCHAGGIVDQSPDLATPAQTNIHKGDSYFRRREMSISDTGISTFSVQDKNIVDSYTSAVSSFDGRPNVIDLNAKKAKYGATIRHGQAYQPNTNINGLNRFFPQDFIDIDYSYGDIERMKVRDRFMRVFQNLKIGSIPLFSKIGKSPSGDEIIIQTNSLLNPVQYYIGDWGIGTAAASLASFNFADYCCDNIKGGIIRVSNNGEEPISILFKVNNWATKELVERKGDFNIYGCFEQKQNNYIIALEATDNSEAQTLIWDEEGNRFDSFISAHPEMMCSLGVLLVMFKDGQLWTHDDEGFYNNFFGTQYDQHITGVFNKNVLDIKTFTSLKEVSSQIWDCPEISTTVKSYGNVKQQSQLIEQDFADLESDYNASFLRDINSIGSILNGSTLKGNWIKVKFRAKNQQPPNNNLITLSACSVSSIDSPRNNR